ncbi:MAG: TetR/AcrR family transcriptional regulator [Vulcanimicrobiaceae bacterium]
MQGAGLTHGGFYAHFASKDELLVEALSHAADETGPALAAVKKQPSAKGSAITPCIARLSTSG